MKPKHQLSTSRIIDESSIMMEDMNKNRPFSLEERNLNASNISFTKILRPEGSQSTLNTTRNKTKTQPPSFYNQDMQKWKKRFDKAVRNRQKLK